MAVGVIATHNDVFFAAPRTRFIPGITGLSRQGFGELKGREGSFVHVGIELAREKDFSVTLTQADFAKNLELLPTSPELLAGRKNSLSMDDAKLRQCTSGELRWVSTVS